MTWFEFARIVKRAFEYLRAFLAELQPIEKTEAKKTHSQRTKSGKKVTKSPYRGRVNDNSGR